jgi:hypothetical protein
MSVATDRDRPAQGGRAATAPPAAEGPGARRVGTRALVALALAAAAAVACTEDPLTGPGPGEGEDDAAETVEFSIGPQQMASWRDTTLSGFALASDAGFVVLGDRSGFLSRGLLRYPAFPDSVEIDDETLEIEEFLDGRIRVVVDSTRSVPPPDGLTLSTFTLGRAFVPDEASWEQAADGQPWDSAGGDLDRRIGSLELQDADAGTLADTVEIPFDAPTDSLLRAWRASDGQPGMALLMEGEGGHLTVTSAFLEFDVRPAGRDTTVAFQAGTGLTAIPSTTVHDPPTPPTGTSLRVGGLPAARFYTAFRPPEQIDGVRLVGGTINRAEIVFPPAPAPAAPFALAAPATASGIRLGADPFELGARTPIGDTLPTGTVTLDPDSLSAGRPLRFAFTSLLRRWASNPDSAGDLRVGVRLRPDAQTIGFWEFGSAASPADVRPFLRVVVTPSSGFDGP